MQQIAWPAPLVFSKPPDAAASLLLRLFAQRGVKMFVCINLQQTTTGVVDVDEDEDDDDDGGGSGSPGAAKREGWQRWAYQLAPFVPHNTHRHPSSLHRHHTRAHRWAWHVSKTAPPKCLRCVWSEKFAGFSLCHFWVCGWFLEIVSTERWKFAAGILKLATMWDKRNIIHSKYTKLGTFRRELC